MNLERSSSTPGGGASLAFVGCGPAAAHSHAEHGPGGGSTAPGPAPGARRQVAVSGRRIKTVDIHAHCSVREALDLVSARVPGPPTLLFSNLEQRLRAMDEQGIDVAVLSINPFWYGYDRDLAAEIIRLQNEKLAEFCGTHRERFAGFATVSLQHPDLAVEQLVHAVKRLDLRGICIGGSVAGEELAAERFHPVWAKAEELGILVFIHPQGTPELASRLGGNGALDNTIGNPLETTIALSHLIFEGTLDRFPGLKILAAHGGGYLPSYAARSDAVCDTFPERAVRPRKQPTEYLKDLYYDALVFTPEALRHLAAEVGPGRIMMGTDYPYPWTSTTVDHILATPGLTDADRIAMLGETAMKLMGIGGDR